MIHRSTHRPPHKSRLLLSSLLLSLIGCGASEPPSLDLSNAWQEYSNSLQQAEQTIRDSRYFTGPVAQAEAYKYIVGLIGLTQRKHMIYGDPAFPRFFEPTGPSNRWGFSNPDNLYLAATVDDRYSYRIKGKLGSANHTTFGSYAGDTKDGTAGERLLGKQIITDAEGHFELVFSKARQEGNWLPLVEGATSITIYQIFGDWENEEKGAYQIERIGSEGEKPPVENPADVSARLINAGKEINHTLDYWLGISDTLDWIPNNTVVEPRMIQIASYGSYFAFGNYSLANNEALIIEMDIPQDASYWGWALYNPWSETLDYANRQTSLNLNQGKVDPDGKLRIVLAHQDPGVLNWLDISGHPEGYMNWRMTTKLGPATPVTQRVALSELKQHLPASTVMITPAQRQQALAERQQQVARRFTK